MVNTNDPDNYFRFSPTGSGLPGYQDFSLPLQIREGDAIRVTYNVPITGSSGIGKVVHQTFSIIGYNLPPPIISASAVQAGDAISPQNLISVGDGAIIALKLEQGAQDYFVNKTDLRGGIGTTQRYTRNQELLLMGYGASGVVAMVSASYWGMSRDYYGPGEAAMLCYKWADNNVPTSQVDGQYKWMITTNTMLLDSGSGRNFGTVTSTPQASYFNWDSQIILSGSYNGSSAAENTANAQANYYESSSIMIDPIIGENAVVTSTPRYIPDPGYIYDRLRVSPDPSTLKDKIPNGVIKQYTIYRPSVEDNRVIVNMTPPTGSRGTVSPSSEGYLIPSDLTQVQKDNIETIINELRSQNAFGGST